MSLLVIGAVSSLITGIALAKPGELDAASLLFRPMAEAPASYIMRRKQVIQSSGEGGPPTRKTHQMTIGVTVAPEKWSDGAGTLSFSIKSISFVTEQDGMTMQFDSSKEPQSELEKALSPSLKPLLGVVVTATIRADGSVEEITGEKPIAGSPVGQQMLTSLTSAARLQRHWWPIFSTRAGVDLNSPIERWESTDVDVFSQALDARVVRTHHVREHVDAVAAIAITGSVQFPEMDKKQPMSAKINDSEVNASQMWNTDVGQLVSYSAAQSVEVGLSLNGVKRTMTIEETVEISPEK